MFPVEVSNVRDMFSRAKSQHWWSVYPGQCDTSTGRWEEGCWNWLLDNECLSEVFLSKQTCLNIGIFSQGLNDGSAEAAITLLTMGDIVLQSEIITEQGDGKNGRQSL